jgi:multiple sugar transport system ATP-binding protein
MTMGDRIVVMNKGLIQQCADPMTVYDHPGNKFVASFIGSPPINFMTGKIIRKDRKYFFDEGKFQVKLIDGMYPKIAAYDGQEIVMGIRSEDIYDKLFASEASLENTVRATCEVVEPLGSEVYLYLGSGKHSFIARVGAHDRPEVNRDMDLVFDMSKVHFFDSKNEETII